MKHLAKILHSARGSVETIVVVVLLTLAATGAGIFVYAQRTEGTQAATQPITAQAPADQQDLNAIQSDTIDDTIPDVPL